jgi:hypothetical protein
MKQYAASLPPRRRGEERSKATPPLDLAQGHESFDLAQDRESFDFAQDRELVERPVERLVEWQMMP